MPGTWLKWYVTDSPTAQPIYFYFVGRLMYERASGESFDIENDVETYVIDSQWNQRIYANEWFLHWLLPLDEGEEGKFIDSKPFTPRAQPEKPKKNPLASAPPLARAATANAVRTDDVAFRSVFPRLCGGD